MPSSGHFWTDDAVHDLLTLARGDFMAKWPLVTAEAYRQRLAIEQRRLAPTMRFDDGQYHPEEWCYRPRQPSIPLGLEKHVNIGDTHGVFVDQPVWAAVLDFVRDFAPDQVNLLGDIADFYGISRFDKDPNRQVRLQNEIDFTREVILAEVRRAAPAARILWRLGNHEERLEKYIRTRAPEFASLRALDLASLFGTDDLDILVCEEDIQVGHVELTHGHMVRKHSGYTAKAMLDEYGSSVIHNHTHRLGAIYKTDRSGPHVAFENGCLCRMDPEYIAGTPNWQHGFSVGWVLPDGRFHFEQIAVVDSAFVYGGKWFGAADILDDCHD